MDKEPRLQLVDGRQVWSLQEVATALARRLEGIPSLWVEGEVHSVRRAAGQVFFTLVDGVQISASMSVGVWDRLAQPPRDGERLHVLGRVEYRMDRSQLGFRAVRVERVGTGALLARIAEVQRRLVRDGLTDPARKRVVGVIPRVVGVITSRQGAALTDFLGVARQRFPEVAVRIADVPVQGPSAAAAVVGALERLNHSPGVDVIVVCRGGGPLEDLMPFNDEGLCRAVATSRVPVVSAVGHERDVTLCDRVADIRVATPTAAAVTVVPDIQEITGRLYRAERALGDALRSTGLRGDERVQAAHERLQGALRAHVGQAASRVSDAPSRLERLLSHHLDRRAEHLHQADQRLKAALIGREGHARASLEAAEALLEAYSPYGVLERGYAIVRTDDGRPVHDAADLVPGHDIEVIVARGRARATVKDASHDTADA